MFFLYFNCFTKINPETFLLKQESLELTDQRQFCDAFKTEDNSGCSKSIKLNYYSHNSGISRLKCRRGC